MAQNVINVQNPNGRTLREIRNALYIIVGLLTYLTVIFVGTANACDGEWVAPGWDRKSLDKTVVQQPHATMHVQREAPGTGYTFVPKSAVKPAEQMLRELYRDRQ